MVQLFQLGLLFSGCNSVELQSVGPTELCLLHKRITLDVQSTGKINDTVIFFEKLICYTQTA